MQARLGRGDGLWGACFVIKLLRVIPEIGTVNYGWASAEFIVYVSAAYNACSAYLGDKGEAFFFDFFTGSEMIRKLINHKSHISCVENFYT